MHIETDKDQCRLYVVRNGERLELPPLWLRERSPDPEQCDPVTHQRLFDPHQLPDDLAMSSVQAEGNELLLAFSDGHAGRYSTEALLMDLDPRQGLPEPTPWTSVQPPDNAFDWSMTSREDGLREVLAAFLTYGFVILRDTPAERRSILEIAESFGCVRDTNFGRMFEVYSWPGSNDLAYRDVALAPHTDNPYREPVPGIQLLQCIVNETSGGLSTLVDGFAVSEALRAENPESYELLAHTTVGFRWGDDGSEHYARRTMISLDSDGAFDGIHYSPRLDRTPLMDQKNTLDFHRAKRKLRELLSDPHYELRFKLAAGELMMFDNIRVLHGRTSFNPQEGHRQLQGCYIDREGPRSHYRRACRSG